MSRSAPRLLSLAALPLVLFACAAPEPEVLECSPPLELGPGAWSETYTTVALQTDLELTANDREVLPLLIAASRCMDDVFWKQAYGDRDTLLSGLEGDERSFAQINYGPWDRLQGDAPFVEGVGDKPRGAAFYPADMTQEELEAAVAARPEDEAALRGLYSMVERDEGGALVTVPYSEAFATELGTASTLLHKAAEVADDPGFQNYLRLLADALLQDDYYASDLAWMQMTDNRLDLIFGPIETYEDQLFGYRAGAEAYVLVKDQAWSERLSRYAGLLADLQRNLPVDAEYKAETPGGGAQLGAYDVVYAAGHANAGSKSIAVNLPNDERVQLEQGTRRLQLKNAMRAKFDEILVPISEVLIAEDQRQHIQFDAFFANTMFHEVAHGLGIKNTLDGSSTVRQALKETASPLEEGKADVLGLFMLTQLDGLGELDEGTDLRDNYVTFLASIFRSIRFGSSSAHGTANLLRFNEFSDAGAFSYDEATGTYRVDFDSMTDAMNALARKILVFQGDGDYDGVKEFMARQGIVGERLQASLDRLAEAGIPVDIVFEQGPEQLGLE